MAEPLWAGIDVGAERKGFDVAVIDALGVVAGPLRIVDIQGVVRWLHELRPAVIAVDSPRRPAPDGELSRADERMFAAARICGIRFTPSAALIEGSEYYAWIRNGFALYEELDSAAADAGWSVIECFPTAVWSCRGGRRGGDSRARWSLRVLRDEELAAVPTRLSQDARDAIGAALTARWYAQGETESFGEIVVPRRITGVAATRAAEAGPRRQRTDARFCCNALR